MGCDKFRKLEHGWRIKLKREVLKNETGEVSNLGSDF